MTSWVRGYFNRLLFNDLREPRANRCHHHTVNIARRYFGGFGGRPCATSEFVDAEMDQSQARAVLGNAG